MAEPIDHPPTAVALAAPPAEPMPATFAGGLLHYRAWSGVLRSGREVGLLVFVLVQTVVFALMAWASAWPVARLLLAALFVGLFGLVVRSRAWPVARVALTMIFRRGLFWVLDALAVKVFLLFFFGQYLMAWATTQLGADGPIGGPIPLNPRFIVRLFRDALKLNGSAETFRNFFHYEGYMVMVVLALAGSLIIGNDFRFNSLGFYLAKPLSRRDYLLGKALAVAVCINLMTTLPAVLLFVQFGLLEEWDYFLRDGHLLVGILAYGLILTATLTPILLASAAWLRKTVPLIMVWTITFFFCRLFSQALVDGLHLDPRWRLIDLWNNAYVLGNACLGIDLAARHPAAQPTWLEAALVLCGVCLSCLSYLIWRVRSVEIVK